MELSTILQYVSWPEILDLEFFTKAPVLLMLLGAFWLLKSKLGPIKSLVSIFSVLVIMGSIYTRAANFNDMAFTALFLMTGGFFTIVAIYVMTLKEG